MADLDLTELLQDPDLCSLFDVKRRIESVDPETGRSVTSTTLLTDLLGFVLSIDPTENKRSTDAQMMSRAIEVATTFRLRGPSSGVQPDIIVYDGIEYTITKLKSHTRWGAGWVKVEAQSMNASDAPDEETIDD